MKRIQAVLCKPESTASSSVNRDFRQQFHSGAYIVLSSCLQIQKNLVSVLKTIILLWLGYDHKMLKKAHNAQASLWGGSFDVLRGLDKSVPSSCTAVVQKSIVECPFLKPDTGSVLYCKAEKKRKKKDSFKGKNMELLFL